MLLGLMLGVGVAAFTYFNDAVIRQTMFIGNFLPISVFGLVILLLLLVNPLLRVAGPRWSLSPGQIAIITAVALSACAWSGSNFLRSFVPSTSLPSHLVKNRPAWQSTHVMSYVPGGSARLGMGHVRDWVALARQLAASADAPDDMRHAIWRRLTVDAQHLVREVAATGVIAHADKAALLEAINAVIEQTDAGEDPLYTDGAVSSLLAGAEADALRQDRATWMARAQSQTTTSTDLRTLTLTKLSTQQAIDRVGEIDRSLNRLAMVRIMPEVLLPPPRGEGLLLNGGRGDPFAVDTLVRGWDVPEQPLHLNELPWREWWPTIRLWGGMALALGLAAICLALIVHPQWSERELLAYPIPRLIEELVKRDAHRLFPNVAHNRLFWYAVIGMLALHGLNGLSVWFPSVPGIRLNLSLEALQALFPNTRRVNLAYAAFAPTIYLSAMAFAYFLASSVSFSAGIALYAWMLLGSIMVANGVAFENNDYEGGGQGQMLRFGGYVAAGIMIIYIGRRYYANVAASALGLARHEQTPTYATWAARLMLLFLSVAVVLGCQAGLDPWMSATLVLLCMLTYLVISRIVAETGIFFVQARWLPMAVLTTLLGAEAIGPTTYIALTLASMMLVGDPREALMPFVVNGLQMGDRVARVNLARLARAMAVTTVLAFVVAMAITFYVSYNRGINFADEWATQYLPYLPFNRLSVITADLTATNRLNDALEVSGLARLTRINPSPGAYWWLGLGMALVFGTAFARLRLSWWPIHPVLFLVWGTHPNCRFHFSFLLGCLVKVVVTRTMGASGYQTLKPLMVGIIAGELLAGLFWIGVGAIYFIATGQIPRSFTIFPS